MQTSTAYTKRVDFGKELVWLTDILSLGENCRSHGVGFEKSPDGLYTFSLECPRCFTLMSAQMEPAPDHYGFGLSLQMEMTYTPCACDRCQNAQGAPAELFAHVDETENGEVELTFDRSDSFQKDAGVFSVTLATEPDEIAPMLATFDSLQNLRLAFMTRN